MAMTIRSGTSSEKWITLLIVGLGSRAIRSLKPGHGRLVGGQGSTTSRRCCVAVSLGAALGGEYLAYAMLESVPIIYR